MIPLQTISQTLRTMLDQVSSMQETPSALERDLLLSRLRNVYQVILELPVATIDQLQDMEEELSPEIEVEFEFDSDDQQECGDECQGQDECHDDDQGQASCNSNTSILPCPHHGEAPLSALVEDIEQEINEPEKLRAQACQNEEQNRENACRTIELIASEIAEANIDEPSPCQSELLSQQTTPDQPHTIASEQEPLHNDSQARESAAELFGQSVSVEMYRSFVDELFDQNTDLYVSHAAQLGAMDSLDDALIFISENHSWHPQSQAAQQFIALLEERYS